MLKNGFEQPWCGLASAELICGSGFGRFVPQYWAEKVSLSADGESMEFWGAALLGVEGHELQTLREGPDAPEYWSVWARVLTRAQVVEGDRVGRLHHEEEDLWLVRHPMA